MKTSIYLSTVLTLLLTGLLSGQSYQLTEDFSGGVPPTGWSIENPDGLEGWEMTTTTQSDGNMGPVARMDNYQYNAPGQEDRLVLPAYTLTRTLAPKFSFDVAYAPFDETNFERLHIEVSTDNGVSFSATAYDKEGTDLATTGNQSNGWGPQAAGDWRRDTLDLTPYAGETIILRFVQTAGFGNGLFIDNIMTTGPVTPIIEIDEDFSGGVPPVGWSVENPDMLEGWEMTTTTQSDGTMGSVARMDNYQYNAAGQEDRLVLPLLDLSGIAEPTMVFDVAYAPFDETNFERLHLEYSTDGGNNFLPTIYDKSGATLATTGNQGNGWGPQVASDWRSDTLDLTFYAGPSLLLRFVQTNGFGNGLFIDNVVVGSFTALPVELLSFNGFAADKFNQLTWAVAREDGFSHYVVERSRNGTSDWEYLGEVAGAGNVEGERTYQFADEQPLSFAYYRLRSVDLDASFVYSNAIFLEQSPTDDLKVYPNPSFGTFSIDLPLKDGEVSTIRLYDASGRQLLETPVSGQHYEHLAKLKSGVYLLVLDAASGRWTQRVMVR